MDYKHFVNPELIRDIKAAYKDFVVNFSHRDVEIFRDGALHQINEQWPDLLDKLTLAPNGVAALETLFFDGEDILLKMILMQILTEYLDKEPTRNETEQESVEIKGE